MRCSAATKAGPAAPAAVRPAIRAAAKRRDTRSAQTRAARPARRAPLSPAPGASGRPLPEALRGELERRFATDLGSVRVHSADVAAESAAALGARAYTLGEDIVMARGAFRPLTRDGRTLVAHEVAHVVQQRRGGPAARGAGVERAAHDAARRFADGAGPVGVEGAVA